MTVSPARFRAVALAALVAMVLIVATGGAVRLTGSGLGCSSWPGCEPGRFIAPLGYHHWVEYGNRIVVGLITVVSLVVLAAALLRSPRRCDLTWLSAGLVGGVLGQIVLGGITVRLHLRPQIVMAHFLLSMLLVLDAAVLHWRSGEPDGPRSPVVRREVQWLATAIVGVGAAVLVLGTVVTGTGPHSGDKRSARFDLDLRTVAQAHADAVMLLIGLTVALGLLLAATGVWSRTRRHYELLVAVMLAQAAIGFTQYALHLPAGLVEVHILGATLFWLAAVRMHLALREPIDVPSQATPASAPAIEALSD